MATVQLDHIVLLLPYKDILDPPSWITDHFTVSPGGRHGDNKTENKLIAFQDGSYIELIAFIDDKEEYKQGHFWGDKGYGIIDYALNLKEGPEAFEKLRAEIIKLDIPNDWKTQPLAAGSRIKPDGDKIEWRVAFPKGNSRGKTPFWCFDVTPRDRRVPSDVKLTTHPSGAIGVGSITIFCKPDESDLENRQKLFNLILTQIPNHQPGEFAWEVGRVNKTAAAVPAHISLVNGREGQKQEVLEKRRVLDARLDLLVDANVGEIPSEGIHHEIEGDQLSIGFIPV